MLVCVRDHVCVFMCHGWQPRTQPRRRHTMGKHRERSGEKIEEREKKGGVEGRQNMLVQHMRACDLWDGSFVLKGTTPFVPSQLCQTSPSPCQYSLGWSLRTERKEKEEYLEQLEESLAAVGIVGVKETSRRRQNRNSHRKIWNSYKKSQVMTVRKRMGNSQKKSPKKSQKGGVFKKEE